MLPVIALIGRPNTGKSTLFNRIIGKKHAIIANEAGTTRDRVYMHTNIGKNRVILVDTGGLSFNDEIDFETEIKAQTKLAIAEADLILFVTDSSQPLTASDQEAAILL
ncbi:ribosome biogenesis GTPase Der, partial [Candidatus Peregrinibacteria bacterium CG_4_9_14_0_2_um_filter_41_14]